MGRNRLLAIFLIVFVDLLGFGLILPLLPFYASSFGANAFIASLLVASYAAAQLIGAPLLGRLSDRYGRRPILLVSLFGTFVGFLLLGFAQSLWMLFASRIIDGLTGGNISVAQAYIADVTDPKDRAKSFGLIGAAFGLGFIIGPAAGGVLSQAGASLPLTMGIEWQYALPAFVAAGLSLLNLILVYFLLPESLSVEARAELAKRPKAEFNLAALRATFARPLVGPLLHTRFWFALAFSTFQAVFPLYAAYRFGLTAVTTAYVLTYTGVLVVLVQGVGIRYIAARFDERRLLLWACLLMSPSLLLWGLAPTVAFLLVVLIPIALAGGVFTTVISSALSKSVGFQEIGGILGLSTSLESASRVAGPTIGGALLQWLGTAAPGVFGAILTGVLASFVWRRVVNGPAPVIVPAPVFAEAVEA